MIVVLAGRRVRAAVQSGVRGSLVRLYGGATGGQPPAPAVRQQDDGQQEELGTAELFARPPPEHPQVWEVRPSEGPAEGLSQTEYR